MDDLEKLIENENEKKPGFREKVKAKSKEIEIAMKLRAAREALNLTQKDISKRCKISLQAISRIESARDYHFSLYTLHKYADILGFEIKMELSNRQEL